MKICTYYETIPGVYSKKHHPDVLELWLETWSNLGFETKVLSRSDAEKHTDYINLLEKVRSFPTINPRQYEEACFVRWCAASAESVRCKIVFMDYDVFPTSLFRRAMLKNQPMCYGQMPCCVSGGSSTFDRFIKLFLEFKPSAMLGHVSDQVILSGHNKPLTESKLIQCYGTPGWEIYPMVHLANWTLECAKDGRAMAIRSFMKNGVVEPSICQ